MDFPTSPINGTGPPKSCSSSSTRLVVDDVTSLTSFNPFSEEDENDQSSYALVSSLFSRVKNSFAAPLTSTVGITSNNVQTVNTTTSPSPASDQRRTTERPQQTYSSMPTVKTAADKLRARIIGPSLAPPLVSVIPALSEIQSFNTDYEKSSGKGGILYSPATESHEGGLFGTGIPGFPIQDDARSIHTSTSLKRSASVSKVIRRIRGEGLSRDYWMDDEDCKECYDCKSVFTAWRRKHHCRICGQIFCSRCASHIIRGVKFGHEGMLRVCNLCLEKLNIDDDDDDDRRSIHSNVSTPYVPQMMDSYLNAIGHRSQSPFTSSQLFGRSDEPFSLYSIAETRRQFSGSDGSGFGSRPLTPGDGEGGNMWEDVVDAQPAPFRRSSAEEDREAVVVPDSFQDQSPTRPRSRTKTPIDLHVVTPGGVDASKSTIQFPGSSPDHGLDSPHPSSLFRSRVNSYTETEIPTPFLRSRVHSRLNELNMGEVGWRTRRESTAYAQELNTISMFHLRIMLRQMLMNEGISNVREWEESLLKLALKIAKELTFTAYPNREGADMDVRRYVKIKKIPGGSPKDSEYVDGAVISKNVAHKLMSRSQKNPRVMLVTFPLEFQRVEGQYMHFDQAVRQEKAYLGNLASRIAALRPHVVLVEKSVSRLALETLVKHNIVVARSVKHSAIQLVARMTQGDIFSSIDKLALEPRLGHCTHFRIQTFDHPLIPSRRKTYMRFEGCSHDLGCTIILRGGDMGHLRHIKKVTLFLAFIVRNLKLETHLWKDSVITAPHLTADAAPQWYLAHLQSTKPRNDYSPGERTRCNTLVGFNSRSMLLSSASNGSLVDDLPNEDAREVLLSRRIQESLDPYLKTFISVSATLRFLPPHPIRRMKELDDELHRVRRTWEDEIISREENISVHHSQEGTITPSDMITTAEDIKAQIEALPSIAFPETPTPGSQTSTRTGETSLSVDYFTRGLTSSASSSSLRSLGNSFYASKDCSSDVLKLTTEFDIASQSALDLVKWQHNEQRRVWEWYLRKNKDDFNVEKYQCISLVEFTLPITELGHHRACFLPELKYMTFYGKNDCTLGQFIDKTVNETIARILDKEICSGKQCAQPLARHCRVYLHNESRLLVYAEQSDGQIKTRMNLPPAPEIITTWSACRACGSVTPFISVSEEMQRYSFAKFLELHFYPADVQLVQGAGCIHNIYQHHIRYFATKGMTVMFQTDAIVLQEIIFPPSRIHIRSETLLQIKNADYERLRKRNAQWYAALVDDLKLINIDAATGDEEVDEKLTAEINGLIERAELEQMELVNLIDQVYRISAPFDTLALNRVRAERQDRIVAWQQDFDKLPKPKLAQIPEKEVRKVSAFNSVRAMWPKRYEFPGVLENLHFPQTSTSGAESHPPLQRRVTGDSLSSTASASDVSDAEPAQQVVSVALSKEGTTSQTSPTKQSNGNPLERARRGSDSDSTIAARGVALHLPATDLLDLPSHDEASESELATFVPGRSKLPRRSGQRTTVAELVKRYQDYLPESVSSDLATTSVPPPVPPLIGESDQETQDQYDTVRYKPRVKFKAPRRKDSTSDFEHSYAANVAPRYLTTRRQLGNSSHFSKIPGPTSSSYDSRQSSRRTSPDKRAAVAQKRGSDTIIKQDRDHSFHESPSGNPLPARQGKARVAGRNPPKERPPASRSTSVSNIKATMRRASAIGMGGKVSNIARHFERLHRDNEKANKRYAVIRGRRARPVASSRATVEIFESVREAIRDESESSDSSSEADDEDEGEDERDKKTSSELQIQDAERQGPAVLSKPSVDHIPSSTPTNKIPIVDSIPSIDTEAEADPSSMNIGSSSTPQMPSLAQPSFETPPQSDAETLPMGQERPSTLMKALSGFWPHQPSSARSQVDFDGDDPMADPEHIFRESSMVVRTDEPTSIIALALNSPQYRDMLAKSRADKKLVREPKISDGGEAFMPDDASVAGSTSTWGVVNIDSTDDGNPTEDLRVPSSKLPWAISFESGGLTITCTILYPEQFDALRRTYDCDRSLIESLARCVKWNASGGKSGSAFLKTQDDRFIAKELSRNELETMATFAPAYFDYMSSAVTADRPTLLAKVFGCYKLVFKKTTKDKERSAKSKHTQMNLLVMENLFYDKRFAKIFDLKGSTRNRHVQSTGRENEVLLDENLVQTAHLSPFYVREHSKRILRGALYNDTKFLADINVMDYSLVVGVDGVKNELVVGIVDYIRTYTWDKKLESWVKESAFLTGAGKGEPTIITPKQYRQRFLSAMERYFPLVPDRWMKQQDAPEEEGDSLLDLWPDW